MRRLAFVIAAASALTFTAAACGSDHDAGHGGDMPMEAGQMPMDTGMPMDETPMGTDGMSSARSDMPMDQGQMGGHGGSHGENSPMAPDARRIEMEATGFRFVPSEVSARPGEDIGIVLTATDIEHDLVIDEFDAHVYAAGGETATGGFTASGAGTYTYYCSIPGHREAGMEGTFVVESA
jgi:plastocyanin